MNEQEIKKVLLSKIKEKHTYVKHFGNKIGMKQQNLQCFLANKKSMNTRTLLRILDGLGMEIALVDSKKKGS